MFFGSNNCSRIGGGGDSGSGGVAAAGGVGRRIGTSDKSNDVIARTTEVMPGVEFSFHLWPEFDHVEGEACFGLKGEGAVIGRGQQRGRGRGYRERNTGSKLRDRDTKQGNRGTKQRDWGNKQGDKDNRVRQHRQG